MTIKRRKFSKGIRLKANTDALENRGEITIDSSDDRAKIMLGNYPDHVVGAYMVGQKVKYNYTNYNCIVDTTSDQLPSDTSYWEIIQGESRTVLTEDQTQTLTNKTIDSATNTVTVDADTATVSNIEVDNLKTGVLNIDLSGAATDTELPSALAVKTALDGQNEASEINYNPAGNPETIATEIQTALDDTGTASQAAQTTADDHIADATDAHAGSAITNTPSGNLAATTVQGALDELQTELDGSALATDLSDHINDVTGAHLASAITNIPNGNLLATTQQDANDQLQSDIDNRALTTELTDHEADTSTHGVTEIVGTTETQVLSGKDIDGGTASDTSRNTLPKAAKATLDGLTRKQATIVYDTDTDKIYKDNGSDLVEIGGSGQGGINYIENGDYDLNTDGTTGDTNLVISQETVAPLRGTGSLKIAKAAIDASTQSTPIPFTIDTADLAQMLTITFDKDFSDANYNDGDAQVRIIQDPAGSPTTIRVANGEDILGGKNSHIAQFQTDHTELDYALEIYWNDSGTDAVNALLDNIQVGPRTVAKGLAGSDPIDFTPSFTTFVLGNGTVDTSWYMRTGNIMSGRIDITVGTTSTLGNITFDIPDGLSISDTLAPSEVPNYGNATFYDTGTSWYDGYIIKQTSTALSVRVKAVSGSNIGVGALSSTVPHTWVSGDEISIIFDNVPIVGWSSNTAMSEDLGGREIVVRGAGNAAAAITATSEAIDWTQVEDTTSSWSQVGAHGTDTFTAPETGNYSISGSVKLSSGAAIIVYAYKNTVQDILVGSADASSTIRTIDGEIKLVKGDTLEFRSNTTVTLTNSTTQHWIHIQKLASPQTILETATVAARYTSNSGQVVGSGAVITYEDLDKDTHNAMSGSTYTVPANGWYGINASYRITTNASTSILIKENGTGISRGVQNDANDNVTSTSTFKYLLKGAAITVTSESTGSRTLNTTSDSNVFSIIRIK